MSSFERPQTIMEALEAIDRYDYALPALQREFVWKPQQIYCLFDSLMKGYPIGSFLLWELEPETAQKFRFYQFMRDYHEWSNRHCAEYPMNTPRVGNQYRETSIVLIRAGIKVSRSCLARVAGVLRTRGGRGGRVAHQGKRVFDSMEEWAEALVPFLAEAPDHDLAPYRNPVTQHIGCVSHDHHGIWSVPYACLSDEEEPMLTNFRLLAETINEIIKRSTPC